MITMPSDATLVRAKADFDRDGFAVIRGFQSAEQVNETAERIQFYVREVLPHMPADAAYYEDKDDPASLFRLGNLEARYRWAGDYLVRSHQALNHRQVKALVGQP